MPTAMPPAYAPMPAAMPADAQSAPQPAPAAPAAPAAEPAKEENTNYIEVKSPIVGTFYRSPSPEKPPYIKVGDSIEVGSVVCIVEAMKLFNEIESEISGKVVKILIEDSSPVEYDQPLFLVDPNG
jgi:acetyl-CoA carboxylase biotin carboxyl carrier protein